MQAQLVEYAQSMGVDDSGTKAALTDRLLTALSKAAQPAVQTDARKVFHITCCLPEIGPCFMLARIGATHQACSQCVRQPQFATRKHVLCASYTMQLYSPQGLLTMSSRW